MLIAFCLYKYFPYGGIQRDTLKMTNELIARGYRVRIYVISWDGPILPDIEIVYVPVKALTNHKLYHLYSEWVHEHLQHQPVDLLVGMNKMRGLDVYYAGDSCFEEKARTQRSFWYRLLPRYRHFSNSERAVFGKLSETQILTISEAQTPYFRRHYYTQAERFHPLPPGIDRDRIAPANAHLVREEFREEFNIPEDDLLLLFVGSGFIKKGLDRALLGFHSLPKELQARTWFYVVGKDHSEPFRRLAARLGIAERVKFMDGRDDVPRFLFSADALVLPAYDELAGMVILESMIAGLPALVTRNCGYAHYLESSNAGLITEVPFSQPAFNSQLVDILTSDQRTRWHENGLAIAKDESIYQLTERAVDFLESQLGQRRPTIAFALFKYFPYGGLQRDFMRVARRCKEMGYRVRVYTLSWQDDQNPDLDVIEVPVRAVTNHRRYARFHRWIMQHLQQYPVPVIVGFNKMPDLDWYYAADSCYEQKAQELRTAIYRRTTRYKLFSRFEKAVFDPQAQTEILLITDTQKSQFQHYYGTQDERLHLLPPGLSRDRRRPANAEVVRRQFRDEQGLADDEYLLVLIGSGFITKGLDRALLAVASLPLDVRAKTRFFVIGQDNPKQFQSMAEELNIADQVTIFSGRDDVPRFLLGADLMIHPAYLESGGLVLLEAIVSGLPVIATDVCGFGHYIEEAQAGELVPSPFSQEYFNQRVLALLIDGQVRQHLSAQGVAFGQQADIFDMPQRVCDFITGKIGERANGETISAG